MPNTYCRALGIDVPALEVVAGHREADTAGLVVVALLESGEPLELDELVDRFERAAIARDEDARARLLAAPGDPPLIRDADRFSLDLLAPELETLLLRLELRPAPAPTPLPDRERPLSIGELRLAWNALNLDSWSRRRLALAVLDAHGAPLAPTEVVDFIASCRPRRPGPLTAETTWRPTRNAPLRARDDGRWEIADRRHEALATTRVAVRTAIEQAHRRATISRRDGAALRRERAVYAERFGAESRRLAGLRRLLLHAFPVRQPTVVALLDPGARQVDSFGPDALDEARELLLEYDLIAGLDVRRALEALGVDPGRRPLHDLAATQKTRVLPDGARVTLDTASLIRWSCQLIRPLGSPRIMTRHLHAGRVERLRQRLEQDLVALHAWYRYGRLHGSLRVRAGDADDRIPAPWSMAGDPKIWELMRQAEQERRPLGLVVGAPPPLDDPTAGELRARVRRTRTAGRATTWLVDEQDRPVEIAEIQRARLLDV